MTIYLIRHGESEHNVDPFRMEHIHDADHNLTEIGKLQAKETGKFLKTIVNDSAIIYSSPYARTMQTAEAIRAELPDNVPFFQNPLLREWELGNLLNISNRTPQLKKEYKASHQFFYRYPNGESMADVYLRAAMFSSTVLQRLELEKRYDHILLVTHSAFIEAFLTFILQLPIDNYEKHKPFENGSVVAINKVNGEYEHKKIFIPNVNVANR